MSLYLLRHCERYKSPEFHTHLTEYGRAEAERLVPELQKLDLDYIYASPFVRTLETIEPFSRFKNIPVRLENSIYECIREPYFDPTNFQLDNLSIALSKNCSEGENPSATPLLDPELMLASLLFV